MQFWGNSGGWKCELNLQGARLAAFSDYPLLLKLMDTGPSDHILGTIDGMRAFEVMTAC